MEFEIELANEWMILDCKNLIKIKNINNLIIFYFDTYIKVFNKKYLSISSITYLQNRSNLKECSFDNCEFIKIYLEENKTEYIIKFKANKERLNQFIDFILLSISEISSDKTNDIFDFLIGQKRFEENKDSL